MEADRLQKQVRTLRKGLKNLPSDPAPEQVHHLRIGARHMESVAASLLPPKAKKTRKLLKTIKPLRKAAGGVRDMDVMTANALKLAETPGRDSLARLVTYLGSARQENAAELTDAVTKKRKDARRRLKRFAKRVESDLKAHDSGARALKLASGVRTAEENLRIELSEWPTLSAVNIHRFRLKIKELRSLLQLDQDFDAGFLRALAKAKNQIGEWHDWQQLSEIAEQILNASDDSALLMKIDEAAKQKLAHALAAANELRTKFLTPRVLQMKAG